MESVILNLFTGLLVVQFSYGVQVLPRLTVLPPPLLQFRSDRGAIVTCEASGHPRPHVTWVYDTVSRDNVSIDAERQPLNPVTDHFPLLTILSQQDDQSEASIPDQSPHQSRSSLAFSSFSDLNYSPGVHGARIRCCATNDVGTVLSHVMVIDAVLITQHSQYSTHVSDAYVISTNTAVMTCDVTPPYMLQYVHIIAWRNSSGNVIENGDKFLVLNDTLFIRDVQEREELMFSCLTENQITKETDISNTATVHVLGLINTPPTLQTPASATLTAQRGGDVVLPCVSSAYPLVSTEWKENGRTITEDAEVLSGVGLLVRNITESATFQCNMKNSLGAVRATINVLVTGTSRPSMSPSEQIVDMGSTASLTCTADDNVTWYYNGDLLLQSARISMLSDGVPGRHILSIYNVTRADRGAYQCFPVKSIINNINLMNDTTDAAFIELGVSSPYIYEHFNTQLVDSRESLILVCIVAGNPRPTVTWYLDDILIGGSHPASVSSGASEDARLLTLREALPITEKVTTSGDVMSQLNITETWSEVGGTYRCEAGNELGVSTHASRVLVRGVPFIRPMSDITAVARDDVTVRCYISGYPITDISWEHGGRSLPTNHRQHISRDGTLTITSIRSSDAGEYVCTAGNGDGDYSEVVEIDVMEPPIIDPFRFPLRKSGDRVMTSCTVSSGDLPINITWMRDGEEVRGGSGVSTQMVGPYSSTLSISDASPDHGGVYTCLARNKAASSNYSATLQVNVSPGWLKKPEDISVTEGQSSMLDCHTTGSPTPVLTWMKSLGDTPADFHPIGNLSDGFRVILPNNSLSFTPTLAVHQGFYLCIATNGVGSDLSQVVHMRVHVPATFHRRRSSQLIPMNYDVTMRCDARGELPVSLSWSLNGRSLNWNNHDRTKVTYKIIADGKRTELTIRSTKGTDSGLYSCHTSNAYGTDSTLIELKVQEPPGIPHSVTIRRISSVDVTIQWQAPFDGHSPITAYRINYGYASEDSNNTINTRHLMTTSRIRMSTLSDLRPGKQYHVTLQAVNNMGISKASEPISVKTAEQAPSGPPINIRLISPDSQTMNIQWQQPRPSDRNGEIIGYYIGYKPSNSTSPYLYVTRAHIKGLLNDHQEVVLPYLKKFTSYSIHVQAFNAEGAGPRSTDRYASTLEDIPSHAPGRIRVTPVTSTTVLVLWSPPADDSINGVLRGYHVYYTISLGNQDERSELMASTPKLQVLLHDLKPFTNYTLRVSCFTRIGESIRSDDLQFQTLEDVPDAPSAIKVTPSGYGSVIVRWLPPENMNGVLTGYTLYLRQSISDDTVSQNFVQLSDFILTHTFHNLTMTHVYHVSVSASTAVGEGHSSRTIPVTPLYSVPVAISSIGRHVEAKWNNDLRLDCSVLGEPAPNVTWSFDGEMLILGGRIHRHPGTTTGNTIHDSTVDNFLVIQKIQTSDSGSYSCFAQSREGQDSISYSVSVPDWDFVISLPNQPLLSVSLSTTSSIEVQWRTTNNGGSRITGFQLFYQHQTSWQMLRLLPDDRSYALTGLQCGNQYKFKIRALNRLGEGQTSDTLTVTTKGNAPIMAPQSMLMEDISSLSVTLNLTTFLDGGCPIKYYKIQYKVWGEAIWSNELEHVSGLQNSLGVTLNPSTWYVMKVTAFNAAGSAESILKFSTTDYRGFTITPIRLTHAIETPVHYRYDVILPLVGCIVLISIAIVWLILIYKKKSNKNKYLANNAINTRLDQSIETSLMRSHNIYVKDNSASLCDPKPHCKDHLSKTHGSLGDNKQHCKDYNNEHQASVSDEQQHCKDHLMTNSESTSSIHTISSKSYSESDSGTKEYCRPLTEQYDVQPESITAVGTF